MADESGKNAYCNETVAVSGVQGSEDNPEDDLFSMFPEGTRIFIRGNQVTFENLTPDLLSVAQSLNPSDKTLRLRSDGDLKDPAR